MLRCTPSCSAISITLCPAFFNASILIRSDHFSCRLPFLFAISATSLSFLLFSPYTTKSRKLFYKSAAYAFTYLQHFLQAVYFFFAWLSGMLFGFFIPEQLGLLWYFLLLRSTYTVVSPVCWLTLGVASSIMSSSILHPNVCTPPQKFPVFLRCSGLSGTFSLSSPPALPIDCLLPYRPTLRMRQALRCMYTFLL